MSRGSQIYNIINTLSRGEKRQFKVQVSKYEKEDKNITSQLFDIIEGLNSWNEDDFKSKAEKAGIKKYIAVHSNNLLTQLLESLRLKESGSNMVLQINKLIEDSMMLFVREEYDLAMVRIKKAKRLATETELFEKLIEILFREREIQARLLNTIEYNDYRLEYYRMVKETIAKLENQTDYFNLVEEVFYVFRTIGHPQDEADQKKYERIMDHPLMKDESLALGCHAKTSFYYVVCINDFGRNNLKNAIKSSYKQVEIFEQNKHFAKANIYTYISILNNLAVVLAQLDNTNEFMSTLNKLRAIPEEFSIRHKLIQQQVFELSYNEEMDFYLIRDKIDEMGSIVPIVKAEITRLRNAGIPFKRFLNLAIRLALYHYRIGEIEQSHHWVKMVMEHDEGKSTVHIDTFAIIMDLVLHFHLGDFEYLQYRINNVKKHLKKTKQLVPVNELFLNTLRQLIRATNNEEIDKALAVYSREFDELPDSLSKMFYDKFLAIKTQIENRFGIENKLD